ncbi:MAG: LysR substrate-binding domain-containing protein [Bacteroidales bacterium]
MTLQQFEYILAVDQFRHFAKAADYCCVTQPTLSTMIQKLEDELEVKIFDRKQQPICPTAIGVHIIEQARVILSQVNQIPDIIKESQNSLSGSFKLGILPTIAPYLLPRFFPNLTKRYPELDLRVIEMKTSEIKQSLLSGDIDAGIVANLTDMEQFNKSTLFYEQFFAYVAPNQPIAQRDIIRSSDLSGEELWLLDEGHCFRDQLVRFCQIKSAQASQLAYSLGSMETFMRMVESGRGVTFIPELATMQLSEKQKELVRPFAIPTPAREIILLTHPNFIRHTLLERLIAEIQASVPREMHTIKPSQMVV